MCEVFLSRFPSVAPLLSFPPALWWWVFLFLQFRIQLPSVWNRLYIFTAVAPNLFPNQFSSIQVNHTQRRFASTLREEFGWRIGLPCKNDLFSETEHQINSAAYMKWKDLFLCILHLQNAAFFAFDTPEHQLGRILNEPPHTKEVEERIRRGSKFEATKAHDFKPELH